MKQPIESNNSTVTLFTDQLHPGTVYMFTLTVHKAGRKPASVNQTVSVTHDITVFSAPAYEKVKLSIEAKSFLTKQGFPLSMFENMIFF